MGFDRDSNAVNELSSTLVKDRAKRRGLVVNVSLIFLSLLILFLVLEGLARGYLAFFADFKHLLRWGSYGQIERRVGDHLFVTHHPYLRVCLRPNFWDGLNHHNSLGYRGDEIVMPKPEGEFRIACVGESSTYDDEIEDYHKAYPAMLEQELRGRGYNATVINAGTSGWSSYETLISLELRTIYLDLNLVIFYQAMNDLVTRAVWPPSAYTSDNAGVHAAFPDWYYPHLLEYSTLCRIFMVEYDFIIPHGAIWGSFDSLNPTFMGYVAALQQKQGIYPSGIFKEVSVPEMIRQNRPIYFENNLRHIAAVAASHQARTLFATFLSVTQQEEMFGPGLAEMNEAIRKVAQEQGMPLFDFAGVFPKDPDYWADDIHNNEKGAALKARMFADFICQSNLIPEQYRTVPVSSSSGQ